MTTYNRINENRDERRVTVARVYDATADLLFEAHTTPEHYLHWYGPRDWPATRVEMDFRVGGHILFALTGPDGIEGTPFGGTYLEIEPNRKIVYTNGFVNSDQDKMIVTILFDELHGKTTVTVITDFTSEAMWLEHVDGGIATGMASIADRLADYVEVLLSR
ncbi:SRPBCC family protein [Sphingomonas sp.]|uniref:SRPBCC family protein n=1 Tax=Sphingomonas sp. TaxID=28214 RepID=UPI003D6D7819